MMMLSHLKSLCTSCIMQRGLSANNIFQFFIGWRSFGLWRRSSQSNRHCRQTPPPPGCLVVVDSKRHCRQTPPPPGCLVVVDSKRHCRQTPPGCLVVVDSKRCYSSSASSASGGPPWRVLFFGTDDFSVESLKLLTSSRSSNDGLVETLEVVTLSSDVPVNRFAVQNRLPVHRWPPGDLGGRFDVGVVVSFGCLLREGLIKQFPFGVLNVHPSLLPRWRGPAPVFHTILHGDAVTGVSIMQIRPQRFDVGPILHQDIYQVPERCTTDQLGDTLAVMGAHLLVDTLNTLCERIANKREQSDVGETSAPKISQSMSWLVWEEQTCSDIDRLFRAIGARIPLRTIWVGKTIKLLDFVGKCHISLSGRGRVPVPGSISYQRESNVLAVCCKVCVPGSISYQRESNVLAVCCKDGWVGFRTVVLQRRLSAADFYNGHLHQSASRSDVSNDRQQQPQREWLFVSRKDSTEAQPLKHSTVKRVSGATLP